MDNEELAALAAQYEAEDIEEAEIVADEVEETEEAAELEEAEDAEEASENPPGYVASYEDYVAAGNDPEKFKGKKAYEAEFQRIQQVKELTNSVKTMERTLKSTVDAISKRDEMTAAQHRKELEAALRTAREDGDIDAALDVHEQLQTLRAAPKQQQENPVIGEFFSNNPVLESPEIKSELARIYNGKLRADGVGKDEQLSDAAMRGYLRASMDSVKAIFPDKFTSPKIARATKPQLKAKPAAKTLDIVSALKSYQVEGASSKNQDSALGIYRMMEKTQGKEAADTFAKTLLGVK